MVIFTKASLFFVCIVVTNQITATRSKKAAKSFCTDNMDSMMWKVFLAGFKSVTGESQTSICAQGTSSGGTTYIQWGRSVCTSKNAELVYDGITGGSSYTNKGSAVNHLCLPKQPQWGVYDQKVNNNPFVGGAVYNVHDINIKNSLFDKDKYDLYGFPCSVCHIQGRTTLMIPGRKECLGGWKKEYTGYLMSGYHGHVSATEFICVDAESERLKKTSNWTDKSILYSVSARCNGLLPCPPYVNGREMTCVVCSK